MERPYTEMERGIESTIEYALQTVLFVEKHLLQSNDCNEQRKGEESFVDQEA